MPEINYSDAERRAYVKADPTAALLARIADLEHERDELQDANEKLSDKVDALRAQLRDCDD